MRDRIEELEAILATERDAFGKREAELMVKLIKANDQLIAANKKFSERDLLVEKMAEALRQIVNGRFHIGSDALGNVFGPPDGVMCRNIAKEALKLHASAKEGK